MKILPRELAILCASTIFTLAVVDCANAATIEASTFTSLSSKIIGGVAPGSYFLH
jgi:hypothetical protein